MRRKTFVPPNFKCVVTLAEPGAPEFERLERGTDAEEVRRRLLDAYPGATIVVKPYDFEDWKNSAREETGRAIAAHRNGQTYKFNDRIWGPLKQYLFLLFDKKCAYCESTRAAVTTGAVEHYRPKSSVAETKHPGYYWLAYHHQNYLPTCQPCNSYKGTHFPVADEATRVTEPPADPLNMDPLDAERPALLNPLHEDPFPESLTFEAVFGTDGLPRLVTAKPLNERAAKSIEILKLNREDLSVERARELAQLTRDALIDMASALSQATPSGKVDLANRASRARYSAACMATIKGSLLRLMEGL